MKLDVCHLGIKLVPFDAVQPRRKYAQVRMVMLPATAQWHDVVYCEGLAAKRCGKSSIVEQIALRFNAVRRIESVVLQGAALRLSGIAGVLVRCFVCRALLLVRHIVRRAVRRNLLLVRRAVRRSAFRNLFLVHHPVRRLAFRNLLLVRRGVRRVAFRLTVLALMMQAVCSRAILTERVSRLLPFACRAPLQRTSNGMHDNF